MSRSRDNASAVTTVPSGVGRNMVINGGMNVAQRGTSLTIAHDGVLDAFLVDRFHMGMGANFETLDGAYSQASDGPDGGLFNSILWTTGTAEAAIASDELFYMKHVIEAQNCQRVALGTSASKQVTLSFYVKSSITGTYGANIYKPDAAGDLAASIVTGTYAISSANTWERKTITFPSGTAAALGITYDNGVGLHITWHLAAGSSYTPTDGTSWGDYANGKWAYGHAQNGVITTAGATWGITGVQVEVGPVATEFEQEDISITLAKCQRYLYKAGPGGAYERMGIASNLSTTTAEAYIYLPVAMRATPTLVAVTASEFAMYDSSVSGNIVACTGVVVESGGNANGQLMVLDTTVSSGLTAGGSSGLMTNNNTTAHITLDAEL